MVLEVTPRSAFGSVQVASISVGLVASGTASACCASEICLLPFPSIITVCQKQLPFCTGGTHSTEQDLCDVAVAMVE